MAQDSGDSPDGLDCGNEWISPSGQESNKVNHQESKEKGMKEDYERCEGETACHERKSHWIISISPPPQPHSHYSRCSTQSASIITCHPNHFVISILIIVVYIVGEGGKVGRSGAGVYVMGFPQGAPAEVCVTLEPRHFGTEASFSSSDYYLTASSSKFGGSFGFSKSGGIKGVF